MGNIAELIKTNYRCRFSYILIFRVVTTCQTPELERESPMTGLVERESDRDRGGKLC